VISSEFRDEIGYWSEVKLEIIKRYAAAYSRILNAQAKLSHFYIDAFAGGGIHLSKTSGEFVPGSPTNALLVKPPFKGYFFIDMDSNKVESLQELVGRRSDVTVLGGDCNQLLLTKVFPEVTFEKYRRALCVLDPYGLHLKWEVLFQAGQMRSVEVFLNFPIMDMNRNVLCKDVEAVDERQKLRMDAFWGDRTWEKAAYDTKRDFFGYPEKMRNEDVVRAFQKRLKEVAGFTYVPNPIPMCNRTNAVVYYLFFASYNDTGRKIVEHIFGMFRDKKVSQDGR